MSTKQIQGYALLFDSFYLYDSWYETIDRAAFDLTDMSSVIFCRDHDSGKVLDRTISATLKLEVDHRGLKFTAQVPDTTEGRDTFELVKSKVVTGCSFAFTSDPNKDSEWLANADGIPIRIIKRINKLFDTCVCTYPANVDTYAWVTSKTPKADNLNLNSSPRQLLPMLRTEKSGLMYETTSRAINTDGHTKAREIALKMRNGKTDPLPGQLPEKDKREILSRMTPAGLQRPKTRERPDGSDPVAFLAYVEEKAANAEAERQGFLRKPAPAPATKSRDPKELIAQIEAKQSLAILEMQRHGRAMNESAADIAARWEKTQRAHKKMLEIEASNDPRNTGSHYGYR